MRLIQALASSLKFSWILQIFVYGFYSIYNLRTKLSQLTNLEALFITTMLTVCPCCRINLAKNSIAVSIVFLGVICTLISGRFCWLVCSTKKCPTAIAANSTVVNVLLFTFRCFRNKIKIYKNTKILRLLGNIQYLVSKI